MTQVMKVCFNIWQGKCPMSHRSALNAQGVSQRTSDGGNGNHSVSLPILLIKIKSRSNASIFIYKLAVGFYFIILHLISYFHKCRALFLGQNGYFLYYTYRK